MHELDCGLVAGPVGADDGCQQLYVSNFPVGDFSHGSMLLPTALFFQRVNLRLMPCFNADIATLEVFTLKAGLIAICPDTSLDSLNRLYAGKAD
jgi:hypothetical protein